MLVLCQRNQLAGNRRNLHRQPHIDDNTTELIVGGGEECG